ncbi:MAG: FecR domain-containing protein [Bacteroidales bacterium]|nr:FecR domain-containing protein [Bacteroidales bacterium]MDD2425520.1 FecR domain-containing protein [Bacteroidales bacterium]MDD3989410.1 FecR domain-containing protein [Bacteroidales bacterium]MDD4638356.1 FecR domain-containing protein [Bacteroidales bacterium]
MKNNFKIEPKFSKSSREIWDSHFEKLTADTPENKVIRVGFQRYRLYYAAAVLILLMMTPLLYTRRVSAPAGEHLDWTLPDRSKLTLNAQSKVTYKPIMWKISRAVSMEGEVFFEVVKGSGFSVKSDNGSVKVLGTSFNVYSRENGFSVSCLSGKVAVKSELSNDDNQVKTILEKGEGIVFRKESAPAVIAEEVVVTSASWREKEFYFTHSPLAEVLKEVSRQYGVDIEYNKESDLYYTGNFSMKGSPEEVITIITLPFSLGYEKTENGYKILKR